MYHYKLNNSYTVYVNWSYYSEAAKICQKAHHKEAASKVKSSSTKAKIMPASLPNGTKVSSQFFGEGTICSTSKDGIVSVAFPSRMVRFIYPDAIQKGQLIAM